ncbi:MAG: Chloride channel protein EriC [uncultured Thiotrichaceae bacterium]|uniref:Chloride channel protein EriC n=1 Tax=uncultured Thiotrichaceae bacterium TaxID=298394 RepID=A0A6S6TLI9_9GAMM|nr:MAG: Chloride channel protein EriC [uncultured Thiotrichaceae bacterium]
MGYITEKLKEWLHDLRLRLARPDALVLLVGLGLITGLVAGGVIVLFRLLVEGLGSWLLAGQGEEAFHVLSVEFRFLFPFLSSVLLALMFYRFAKKERVFGVAHVMERMAYHQGHFSIRGFILQFLGAAIALMGGHSVGREGPHVHLGAASGSLFGQAFKLPNNSLRIMAASGVAAAIAASFNTPLAGVIFALEVVMLEYTLTSFIPIILAAGVATALSNAVIGNLPAFDVPELQMIDLTHLPLVVLLGVIVGTFAAIFIAMLEKITIHSSKVEIWWRVMLAGILVGIIGMFVPDVMGIGYDTVNATLLGEMTLSALLILVVMKMLATSFCVGLGIPGGMIGPAFFIGATLGAAMGVVVGIFTGASAEMVGFYAVLGMGAMVAASLQAPLAALTAIIELTYNPGIIMPAMITIVVAQLIASEVFNKQSLFVSLLKARGQDYKATPIMQSLRRVGVGSVMYRKFVRTEHVIEPDRARRILENKAEWIVIDKEGQPLELLPAIELAHYIERKEDVESIDLAAIPAKRMQLSPISLQSNLHQAHEKFTSGDEALFVVFNETKGANNALIYGILTPNMVESVYKLP